MVITSSNNKGRLGRQRLRRTLNKNNNSNNGNNKKNKFFVRTINGFVKVMLFVLIVISLYSTLLSDSSSSDYKNYYLMGSINNDTTTTNNNNDNNSTIVHEDNTYTSTWTQSSSSQPPPPPISFTEEEAEILLTEARMPPPRATIPLPKNLQLFVFTTTTTTSTVADSFPPQDNNNNNNNGETKQKTLLRGGIAELEMTLIRSLNFFWPNYPLTVVLHDNDKMKTSNNAQSLQDASKTIRSAVRRGGGGNITIVPYETNENENDISSVDTTPLDTITLQPAIQFFDNSFDETDEKEKLLILLHRWRAVLWADNFTTTTTTYTDYIGFVNEDTLFTRIVADAEELFYVENYHDDNTNTTSQLLLQPRAIVRHAVSSGNARDMYATWYSLGWPTLTESGRSSSPIIVKRSHLPNVRQAILEHHSTTYNCLDDFLVGLLVEMATRTLQDQQAAQGDEIPSSPPPPLSSVISEFTAVNIVMEYVFRYHRDEYRWHFDESSHLWGQRYQQQQQQSKQNTKRNDKNGQDNSNNNINKNNINKNNQAMMVDALDAGRIASGTIQDNGVTLDMLEPFPRVALHASHIFPMTSPMFVQSSTVTGRKYIVDSILREGYCYSSVTKIRKSMNRNETKAKEWSRCALYHVEKGLHTRGEWTFEAVSAYWLKSNPRGVVKAHIESIERIPKNYEWDEEELQTLFR